MSSLPQVDGRHGGTERKREVHARRMLIVDRQLFGESLRHSLLEAGHSMVDVATSGSEALAALRTVRPDIVIVGIGFTEEAEAGILSTIVSEFPECRVIVLVDEGESAPPSQAGTERHGVVSKATPASQFVRAVEDFLMGHALPPTRKLVESHAPRNDPWIAGLTRREREVLQLLACGATSEEIAARLGVQANTARKHVQNVLTKLQVHSRLEAVAVAIRRGIVKSADVDAIDGDPRGHRSASGHLTYRQ
jgi:two-component system nitrate/nitrite response regulator NarL